MQTLNFFVHSILLVLFGIPVTICVTTFILASIPIYLYRFIITKFVSRSSCFRPPNLGKAVSVLGTGLAVDFLRRTKYLHRLSRCAIVVNMTLEDVFNSKAELVEQLKNEWINAKDTQGDLCYPELQQYIESWMGFMFWKQEENCELEDHVFLQYVPQDLAADCEEQDLLLDNYVTHLSEGLMNKPFPVGKSPWEIHLVQNNNHASQTGKQKSALVLRMHHAMADGYSILFAIIKVLGGAKEFDKWLGKIHTNTANRPIKCSPGKRILQVIQFPVRALYDMGYLGSLYLRRKTGWSVPDQKKDWYQFYHRSRLIPISKMKQIKNKFKVSFTSLLLSCLSGGLAKQEQTKSNGRTTQNITCAILLPVSGHSKKLRNQFTGTFFDLPVNPNSDPISRLNVCESRVESAKSSLIPCILKCVIFPAVLAQLAPIAKFGSHNRAVPTGMTSFRASDFGTADCKKGKLLACDYATGGSMGDCGVAFMVCSYGDCIRISATAERSVITKEGLVQLFHCVEQEIESLERLSCLEP